MAAQNDRPTSRARAPARRTGARTTRSDPPGGLERVVVIGASAGGVEALQRTVRNLPARFPAPIVIVLHTPSTAVSRLPEILERAGALPAAHVVNGQRLHAGRIHVAPPDRHVVVTDHRLALVEGPRENGVRPAIDPLFRSAARAYGRGTIGTILSGTLDDGTAGIAAIHAEGGITIAQDPSDAICPGMPQSAIENASVDHVVGADRIAELLIELVANPSADRAPARRRPSTSSQATDLICPECGGSLRGFEEYGVFRFHCRVGHNYSAEALYGAHDARLEAALWTAIRSLEESASMAHRLAVAARHRGAQHTATRFENRERDAAERADIIRSAILALSDIESLPAIAEAQPVAHEDDVRQAELSNDREAVAAS